MDSKTKLEIKESDFRLSKATFQLMKSWLRKQKRFRVYSIARKASVANVQIAKSGYYPLFRS
jgi:hypothetical protein